MERLIIAAAARKTAEKARERNAWNYDTIEVKANDAVADMFDAFAEWIENPE